MVFVDELAPILDVFLLYVKWDLLHPGKKNLLLLLFVRPDRLQQANMSNSDSTSFLQGLYTAGLMRRTQEELLYSNKRCSTEDDLCEFILPTEG